LDALFNVFARAGTALDRQTRSDSIVLIFGSKTPAAIAQLGERQTEDLKVTGSIPVRGIHFCLFCQLGLWAHLRSDNEPSMLALRPL
jgi:hypothetical protein